MMEAHGSPGSLEGKVALITGSGRGMGRAHALTMAERGADIIVHDIKPREAEETADLVRAKGRRALVAIADVSDSAAITAVVAKGEQAFGRIDILVNNAGITPERHGIDGIDEAIFDRMFGVHVKGTIFATKAAVRCMKQRKAGKIINTSSINGLVGHHFGACYCGAKAAILGLTKAWAKEFLPYGICVNAVAPGGVRTLMQLEVDGIEKVAADMKKVPMGRYAEPEEIAWAVAFLASSQADFMTGQVISQNGGEVIT